ncbi:MAG: RidA family protein [bacterium]|nr:RidA family protein [bacterium]
MHTVQTEKAPKAIGPYSQATVAGDTIFCSGQIAIDPATGEFVKGGIREQTEQIFKNLGEVLRAAGVGFASVASVNVYLRDMNDFKDMNEVYAAVFGEHKPARATVGVSSLPKNARIEVSCIALRVADSRKPSTGADTGLVG